MASPHSVPSVTGLGMICVGASCTAIGGLGVGFRAAGLGYLGQSLLALVAGMALLAVGLRVAAHTRRSTFDSLRRTPSSGTRTVVYTTAAPQVARVRVHAWTPQPLALPPARHG